MLKNKSEVFENFQKNKNLTENYTVFTIKYLPSNNGGEYCDSRFNDFCKLQGFKEDFPPLALLNKMD